MLFVFMCLMAMGIVLIVTEPKSISVRWASTTIFCGASGGLSAVIEDDLMPFCVGDSFLFELAMFGNNLTSFITQYGVPYSFLMFAIVKSFSPSKKNLWLCSILLFIPIILTFLLNPFYPRFIVPYLTGLVWIGPYVLVASLLLIYSYVKEENPFAKRERFWTNVAYIPTILFVVITNNLVRGLGYESVWRFNLWIVMYAAGVFLYAVFRDGFAGVRLLIQKHQMNQSLKAVHIGTAFLHHSLKNDLGIIKLLGHKVDHMASLSGDKELKTDVNIIIDSYERIQFLLDKIQYQTNERELQLTSNSLTDMVENSLQRLKPLSEKREIQVHSVFPEIEFRWMCDQLQIEEAIHNILMNGIDAMPNGGELFVRIYYTSKQARVVIKDTGVGISAKHLNRIIEPFFSTKQNLENNMGLGLTYCYSVLDKHGGSLEFHSQLGEGTTVLMSFPLTKEGSIWSQFTSYWSKTIRGGNEDLPNT
ncbi:Histidine kinase-, DNA gyrase B-, and HSP90-like ATPase [Thermoactinomyces sp. DSM 45891]|uniref:sensor histidine kinase n=1 Tax=Thermoactinomyces sp. DSM 45891 TaxID=1761907 RepID=UPI0009225873|nr:HAMP domain-containing sensor histidine kinase [Thermoactinomyces sp. DSM 45891]SFX26671.1 Histidine kinase-, DNA gyrase B-, and HSP90-like ATPase [Thermoactinomyces sp. DSM 45891]